VYLEDASWRPSQAIFIQRAPLTDLEGDRADGGKHWRGRWIVKGARPWPGLRWVNPAREKTASCGSHGAAIADLLTERGRGILPAGLEKHGVWGYVKMIDEPQPKNGQKKKQGKRSERVNVLTHCQRRGLAICDRAATPRARCMRSGNDDGIAGTCGWTRPGPAAQQGREAADWELGQHGVPHT